MTGRQSKQADLPYQVGRLTKHVCHPLMNELIAFSCSSLKEGIPSLAAERTSALS